MTVNIQGELEAGKTVLGIELGSTNIKAVLLASDFSTIASGGYGWENKFEDGNWTYPLSQVWTGIQSSFEKLAGTVSEQYGVQITKLGAIGVSAMMHGYLAFDKNDDQLVPFRTWRNNTTAAAAKELTDLFDFNIPQRWSIAHLYQAVLNGEAHVKDVTFFTTLAGYVHWQLSGERVIGLGDASGMFPIDSAARDYDRGMVAQFEKHAQESGFNFDLRAMLPKPLAAGAAAGHLTAAGAKLLDPTGTLQPGSVMAPPEGDAGTGMTGTNAVRERTGNISAGTSAFSMVVLDKPLSAVHRDIDMVTTPEGAPVAMVHTNNCTSDLNAWVGMFRELAETIGANIKPDELYLKLFERSVQGDPDAGGLTNYAYLSGENVTDITAGRPMFVRTPNSKFTLANFIKSQIYSAFAPLKIGNDILNKEEHVDTDVMIAQGGIFRTPKIAQQILADALNTPVTVMANAGEGGPWGMAVLAAYVFDNRGEADLADFLDHQVFAGATGETLAPQQSGVDGFDAYISQYQNGLPAEAKAGETLPDYQA